MNTNSYIYSILLLLFFSCDRQLIEPTRNNPFDSNNNISDPFIIKTTNLSDHIQISWSYAYEKPIIDQFTLYRSNGNLTEAIYTGIDTTYSDNNVEWDSTYAYYVTGQINNKETAHPEINILPQITRRIVVGEEYDFLTISEALNTLGDGDMIYVKNGTYKETLDFDGKKIQLKCMGEIGSCIIEGDGSGPLLTFSGNEDSTSILDGFKITGGNNNQDGGAMVIDSDPLITNCIFENNFTSDFGGAIMIQRNAKPILRNCQFINNQSDGDGGAIFCDRDAKPIIENCIFSDNKTNESNGGAIAIDEASPHIISSTFINNKALSGNGGAISINDSRNINIEKSNIHSNISEYGGGIYIYDSKNIECNECYFKSNEADFGAGAYIDDSGINAMPIKFINSILWLNEAYEGGAIYSYSSVLEIDYCTLYKNSAIQDKGGGIFIKYNTDALISNSILWYNLANSNPEVYHDGMSSISITYSNINEEFEGEGNLNPGTDPLFIDAENDNFQLEELSPCNGTDKNYTQMGAFGGIE